MKVSQAVKTVVLATLLVVIVIVALVAAIIAIPMSHGIGYWGPERTWTATVTDKWIDTESDGDGGRQSHYMVSTDKGVFECDNSLLLGIWNADEIYGQLDEDKTYTIKTRGNGCKRWYIQEYPYVISVEEVPDESPDNS